MSILRVLTERGECFWLLTRGPAEADIHQIIIRMELKRRGKNRHVTHTCILVSSARSGRTKGSMYLSLMTKLVDRISVELFSVSVTMPCR
jgi:hypothetical protein